MAIFCLATSRNASCIGQLRQKCWAATYRGIYPDAMIDEFDVPWHLQRDLARLADPNHRIFLIVAEGKAVGYMDLRLQVPVMLVSLYILPEYQGCGMGRAAFAKIRQMCSERGSAEFFCQCHPENAPALGFYRRMGGCMIDREDCQEAWQSSVMFRFSAEGSPKSESR